jgi:bifunctional UDP-N-acetylglucosamine pyrophosphorylase/glucosamine-1-phosphate N-acetyltransferase
MRSTTPKVLHEILGRSLIDWAVAACVESGPDRMLVVVPPGAEAIRERLPDGVEPVTQEQPSGPATPSERRAERSRASTATFSCSTPTIR